MHAVFYYTRIFMGRQFIKISKGWLTDAYYRTSHSVNLMNISATRDDCMTLLRSCKQTYQKIYLFIIN